MAVQGSLATISVPEILSLLYQLRKTGVLTLVTEQEERAFLFDRGSLVSGTAKSGSRQLGSFLVRMGRLTAEQLKDVLEADPGASIYLGQRLVDLGLVTQEDVNTAVKEQILSMLEDVLGWSAGAFHFADDEIPFSMPGGPPASTHTVILEATRRTDEKRYVKSLFPDLNVVLCREENAGTFELEAGGDSAILALVDGKRTIQHVLFDSPQDEKATAKRLHDLLWWGIVRQARVEVEPGEPSPVPELRSLPVTPDVTGRLFAALNGDGNVAIEIGEVIATDPMLLAKVLRSITSKGEELPRATVRIQGLLGLLDVFQLRSILVPEALRGLFLSHPGSSWKEYLEHSVFCARLSEQLARCTQYPYPDEVYVAALLHNLGVFVLLSRNPEGYLKITAESLRRQQDLEGYEEEVFGISHTRLGGILAEKCRFPKVIHTAMKAHHRPEACASNPIVSFLGIANAVADNMGLRVGYVSNLEHHFDESLERLDLDRKKVVSLVSGASAVFQPVNRKA